MFGISFSITFQWRNLILDHQLQNTQELTRTFSIPVLDAMIFLENDNEEYEPHLRSQIQDFTQKVSGLRYIMLTDTDHRIIAHSDITRYNQVAQDTITILLARHNAPVSMIYNHEKFGWIIEVAQPLKIAGKSWGNLRVAIDAEPLRAEIRMLFLKMHSFTLLLIIITLSVIYYLVSKMTNSLHNLVETIDKIDLESDEFQDMEISNDEIGYLTRHFRNLEQRLSQSHTKLLDAQRQIYQAEKLASIGRLSSGVAHEINNPLNGIRNCLYSIRQEPENKELQQEYFQLIDEGINHIESVVQKLLGFSRHSKPNISSVNINSIIGMVLHLLSYQMDKKYITISTQLEEHLPEIAADTGLIQEIVMNLLLNSYDAVDEKGKIILRSGQLDHDQIYFSVEDNGAGIPPEEQQHIFDPFFTTKDPGKGTGLGLSVSMGIVEAHGGTMTVYSEPNKKTIFTVTLPIKGKHESITD
jgi:signal transduction histidine kinase